MGFSCSAKTGIADTILPQIVEIAILAVGNI
jgi:hypothetical protein